MIRIEKVRFQSFLTALAVFCLMAVPAAARYQIYDLGFNVTTQDIQADNTNTVHLVWVDRGILYYGQIVNNTLTGKVKVATKVSTRFWRPYLSVRPDGKAVHTVWCLGGGKGNKVMHSWRDAVGRWRTQTIYRATSSKQASMPSCAVDAKGQVHVLFGIYNDVASNRYYTLFYKKRSAGGAWGRLKSFAPKRPEHTFPMMFTDSSGDVHATWCVVGLFDGSRNNNYYCTAPSGGTLSFASRVALPKGPGVTLNGYGEIYVDRNGVVHRSIGGWSGALKKMCIDHTKKLPGGMFSVPTRASIDFLNVSGCDPVPAVVAAEDGTAIVAWGQVGADGSNMVMASFYDPDDGNWTLAPVDPAAGVPAKTNAYRVAMTRTETELYGVWRASTGRLHMFVLPTVVQNNQLQQGIVRID
jgi:hypothetical protein